MSLTISTENGNLSSLFFTDDLFILSRKKISNCHRGSCYVSTTAVFGAGGQDSEGTLENYEEVGPLFKRALMRVRWVNGGTNIYRVGFKGNVDVVCIEEEARFFYYRDHLPCLGQ